MEIPDLERISIDHETGGLLPQEGVRSQRNWQVKPAQGQRYLVPTKLVSGSIKLARVDKYLIRLTLERESELA